MVCDEFYAQGDLEKSKGLPVSMYCDRETANLPKSQAGFLKNICVPLYDIWNSYLNSEEILYNCYNQLASNLHMWNLRMKQRKQSAGFGKNFLDSTHAMFRRGRSSTILASMGSDIEAT